MSQTNINSSSINMVKNVISEVRKAVIGKDEIIIKCMLAILSRGHILLEDIPGVGKTTLAVAFSKSMALDFKRMQFTPDVLPSDVVGFNIYNKQTQAFEYKPGAACCSMFLADEINRTSSKTQSALLEVMEEGSVTVDGVTRHLPEPFIVIATQNPAGSAGTQLLPESQLDRFIVKLSMGYPDIQSEINIMKSKQSSNALSKIKPVAFPDDIVEMQDSCDNIYIDDKIYAYIANLAAATRKHPAISLGISPRGTVAVAAMTKAAAMLRGRDFALPEDVRYVFKDVCAHRIVMSSRTRANGTSAYSVLEEIMRNNEVPNL